MQRVQRVQRSHGTRHMASGAWCASWDEAARRAHLGLMLRASLPMMSGEAVRLQMAICVRSSSSVRHGVCVPLLFEPMSSMSGSFQWPGPAAAIKSAL